MATHEGDGDWKGSVVTPELIAELQQEGVLGTEEDIQVRLPPADEIRPAPRHGESVLFVEHLERGLALPMSLFFRQFLEYFELQPHYLRANSISQLSFLATLCEAYLGIWPNLDLFYRFFFIRGRQKTFADGRKEAVDCGSAVVYKQRDTPCHLSKCRTPPRTGSGRTSTSATGSRMKTGSACRPSPSCRPPRPTRTGGAHCT